MPSTLLLDFAFNCVADKVECTGNLTNYFFVSEISHTDFNNGSTISIYFLSPLCYSIQRVWWRGLRQVNFGRRFQPQRLS